jgi:hypothetical protein
MSSVAPNDSVSSAAGKNKKKPGRAERAAKRAASEASGVLASSEKARAFASSGSLDPSPQPGKYPVVFATGAGEPSRDEPFVYDPDSVSALSKSFYGRYRANPKYAEFRAHSGVSDGQFASHLSAVFLLGLAQQTVHAHVNMGLPQLDFAPVAATEIRVPSAQLAVLGQFGEFSEAVLGTRYCLEDYTHSVTRLIFAAQKVWNRGVNGSLDQMWLPMSSRDGYTRMVVGSALRDYLEGRNLSIPGLVLEEAVLSGDVPAFWENLKPLFGSPPGEGEVDVRDRFDFLFKNYSSEGQFVTAFSTESASSVLEELSLDWENPSAGHLDWSFNHKQSFSDLCDKWARVSAAYAQFFELGSSIATRSAARGSPAQFVDVSTVDVVTVVKTYVALTAPQFSLAACFPPECIFPRRLPRNVIVTTPIPVEQRATEFCQTDWR